MRFLVDESAGTAVVNYLRGAGHDVVAVAEAMPQADDASILATAVAETRIIVTNDKDFGELLFRNPLGHAGIILLRLRDESAANRVRVLQAVLDQHSGAVAGRFVVAREGHIRVRQMS